MNGKLKARIIERFGCQADFSMRVHEDETVISRVIRGRRQLTPERQEVWAELLECEVDDIFPAGSGVCGVR